MKRTIRKMLSIAFAFCIALSFNSVAVRAEGISIGSSGGNIYENEFFNIRVVLPDNFAFIDNERLAEESELSLEELENPELAVKQIDEGVNPFVAYAYDDSELNNVNITIGYLEESYSETDIFALIKDSLGTVYKGYGYDEFTIDVVETEIAGETHQKLESDLLIGDRHVYQEVVVLMRDGYLITITASTADRDLAISCIEGIEKMN